ncbi:hypothetical protein PAXRUDRAFT_37057 [Paxillus rubicundulus Ve08.2h10]|uniref:Uncharacterized protein n=1 Tax=Paxillus rubicundulus Ve08.2h10 TaxID=930991 RepID=A0A0D0CEW2_9AGAM|nr:hypothetical protein PAXRUDRAFT_37057 [Paxillus rubicundulus Ve08.2h10]
MPPNHQHFQMHCQQLEKAKAAQALALAPLAAMSGPIINFNFPPKLLQFLQGPCIQPPAPVSHVTQELKFIGDHMTVQEFSSVYNLSDKLESKLIKHGYISTHALCYASIEDLESVGLLHREITQLHDAVSHWCDSSKQRG